MNCSSFYMLFERSLPSYPFYLYHDSSCAILIYSIIVPILMIAKGGGKFMIRRFI